MLEFLEDKFLSQLVSEPTRENSILDIVIASQDHLINNVIAGEHLGSCDHKIIRPQNNMTTNVIENRIIVPNFRRGNFEPLRSVLLHLSLPVTDQVDDAWSSSKIN